LETGEAKYFEVSGEFGPKSAFQMNAEEEVEVTVSD
jgi:hypothetical protein